MAAPCDHGAVAVIDGTTLKLTPFRTANVPPPMALFEMAAPSSILDVAFSPANTYMGLLHTEGFSLYEWKLNGKRSIKPVLVGSLEFAKAGNVRVTPLQIFVSETGNVYCLCHSQSTLLQRYVLDSTVGDFTTEDGIYAGSLSGFAGITQASTRAVLAFDSLGKLHNVAHQEDEIFSVRLPSQLPWTQVVDLAGHIIAFGLSRNGHLYANSRLLLKNCTSFLITTAHVVVTTSNHLVKFIHLTDTDSKDIIATNRSVRIKNTDYPM